jgi:hypothetical protein
MHGTGSNGKRVHGNAEPVDIGMKDGHSRRKIQIQLQAARRKRQANTAESLKPKANTAASCTPQAASQYSRKPKQKAESKYKMWL